MRAGPDLGDVLRPHDRLRREGVKAGVAGIGSQIQRPREDARGWQQRGEALVRRSRRKPNVELGP